MSKEQKKRVYAKDKTPYLSAPFEITNPMRLLIALKKKENAWSDFIDKVVYGDMRLDLPLEENLKLVMSYIPNLQTKETILVYLMKLESYNPFRDKIPTHMLPKNFARCIEKAQLIILDKKEMIKELKPVEKNFVINSVIYEGLIIPFTKENLNKELFEMGHEFLMLHKDGRFLFTSNPALKELRPNLAKLFEYLDNIEPNVWYLHGSRKIIMTRSGMVSKLNLKQINLFLNKLKY